MRPFRIIALCWGWALFGRVFEELKPTVCIQPIMRRLESKALLVIALQVHC